MRLSRMHLLRSRTFAKVRRAQSVCVYFCIRANARRTPRIRVSVWRVRFLSYMGSTTCECESILGCKAAASAERRTRAARLSRAPAGWYVKRETKWTPCAQCVIELHS